MNDQPSTLLMCPQCGYPVPFVAPDTLLHQECPLCQTSLTRELKRERQKLKDERTLAFLRQFFDPPKLITVQELADFLRISDNKVRELVNSNKLGAINVVPGSSRQMFRFQPQHVLTFLETYSNE